MSHVTEMDVDVNPKYINEFIDSLKEHFGENEVEVNLDQPITMKRWNGTSLHTPYGDYGVSPECHIVVRKSAQEKVAGRSLAVNDLGYRIEDGKVQGFVDVAGFGSKDQDKVMQEYTARVTAKQLKKKGYSVKKVKDSNGNIMVKASAYR